MPTIGVTLTVNSIQATLRHTGVFA